MFVVSNGQTWVSHLPFRPSCTSPISPPLHSNGMPLPVRVGVGVPHEDAALQPVDGRRHCLHLRRGVLLLIRRGIHGLVYGTVDSLQFKSGEGAVQRIDIDIASPRHPPTAMTQSINRHTHVRAPPARAPRACGPGSTPTPSTCPALVASDRCRSFVHWVELGGSIHRLLNTHRSIHGIRQPTPPSI